jgi:hypothetical protein
MQKTGESYTAARAHLLERRTALVAESSRAASSRAASAAPSLATLAGMSDAKLAAATGHSWAHWVEVLDQVEAAAWPHARIARHLHERHRTPSWWTQTIAVGYERIKGLRAIGQRRDGSFEATRSRTLPVTLSRLFTLLNSPKRRDDWLGKGTLTLRKATRNKYLRFNFRDGTPVEFGFASPGKGKAQIAISHRKLASKAEAERWKKFWSARLDELASLIQRG